MKKIFLLIIILIVFISSLSYASAKEDTHFDLKLNSYGSCVIVTLKDSNNKPIPNKAF